MTSRRAARGIGRPAGAPRPGRRALGCVLAALALLVQAVLPLADAGWHAAHRDIRQIAAAGTAPGTGKTTPGPHSGLIDDACQLCLAMHAAGATLAGDPPTAAAPVAFVRLAATPPTVDAPTDARVAPHRARAPPVRA